MATLSVTNWRRVHFMRILIEPIFHYSLSSKDKMGLYLNNGDLNLDHGDILIV